MNNNYTDQQLKQALAKILPERLHLCKREDATGIGLYWQAYHKEVLDTELLHLCWLVETSLTRRDEYYPYMNYLNESCCMEGCDAGTIYGREGNRISATWQQRVIALCKVKGITI
jgi:hypothetical protein